MPDEGGSCPYGDAPVTVDEETGTSEMQAALIY